MKSQRLIKTVLFICVSELLGLNLVAEEGKDSAIYMNIREHLRPSEEIPALIADKQLTINGYEIRWMKDPYWAGDRYRIEIVDDNGRILPVGGYFTEDYGAVRMVLSFTFAGECPEIMEMPGVIRNYMLPVDRVYDIHLNEAGEVTFLEYKVDSYNIADIQESLPGLVYITNEWNSQPQLLVDCARIDGDLLWKRKDD